MLHNHMSMWQQECATMTKHVRRVINLANEDVDLVGTTDRSNMELFPWQRNAHDFRICM